MKPKAIVFDMDLTLINSIEKVTEIYQYTAKKYYELDIQASEVKNLWGKPHQEITMGIFGDVDNFESILSKLQETKKSRQFPIEAYEGVVDLIGQLVKSYTLGVLTSTETETAIGDIKNSGFDLNDFYFIQGADLTDTHKPDPKVFEPALEKLALKNIEVQEILYVGDGTQDYLAADGAGLDFIAVTTGMHSKEDFIDMGLDEKFILDELKNLPDLLSS